VIVTAPRPVPSSAEADACLCAPRPRPQIAAASDDSGSLTPDTTTIYRPLCDLPIKLR